MYLIVHRIYSLYILDHDGADRHSILVRDLPCRVSTVNVVILPVTIYSKYPNICLSILIVNLFMRLPFPMHNNSKFIVLHVLNVCNWLRELTHSTVLNHCVSGIETIKKICRSGSLKFQYE